MLDRNLGLHDDVTLGMTQEIKLENYGRMYMPSYTTLRRIHIISGDPHQEPHISAELYSKPTHMQSVMNNTTECTRMFHAESHASNPNQGHMSSRAFT